MAVKKRKKNPYRTLASAFLTTIYLGALLNAVVPDKAYSEAENRNLQTCPAFSMESFRSGQFSSQFEDYVSDQFVFRDQWVTLKSTLDRLTGRTKFSDVYLGKDGLLEEPKTPAETLQATEQAINTFAKNHADQQFAFLLVPNAAAAQPDRLPKHAPVRDQNADIDAFCENIVHRVKMIDVRPTFADHADEALYYQTDHHWTSFAAKLAFDASTKVLDIENPAADYDIYTVSNSFEGTLSARSGIHQFTDSIQVYLPKVEQNDYVVEYVSTMTKSPTLYDESALDKKDQYEVFLGGNHPQVNITTTKTDGEVLLVLKDSYANSFLPFLTPYYSKIIVVDPRYYTGDLDTLIEAKSVDRVLFLYNANTLFEDKSLAGVLDYAGTSAKEAEQPPESEAAPSNDDTADVQQ